MKYRLQLALALSVLLGFFNSLNGQFYNGLQMTFGKNRVQYYDFYWQYYRFDKFDVYFNEYGSELALYTEWYANQEIKRLEGLLDFSLEKRIIFLTYNKLTDFRQSNIGLINGLDDYNTGGVTRLINNKVFLYYEGDHKKFQHQITSSIAEIMVNKILYGDDLRENVANSTLINLPEWYTKGLLSYLSESWSVEIEDRIKDGILNGKYKKINRLTGEDAVYAGHSFWRYIERTYGKSVIPNILYITRVNKSAKYGFLYVLGSSMKDISKEWLLYYNDKYKNYADIENAGNTVLKRPKKTRVYENIKLSPDGTHLTYVTNESGQYRLWLYDNVSHKRKCLLKREHKLDQIPDYSFPVLAWHPKGKIVSFIIEEKGGLVLSHYNWETKELIRRNFLDMEKVLSFSYSKDGSKFVMSAIRNGKTDIYVHTLASSTNEQITNDLADDLTPKFTDNTSKIIFSSNRLTDSIEWGSEEIKPLSPLFKLYICPYPGRVSRLTEISDNEPANSTQPLEIAKNKYTYLSDKNGIINRYIANYDSLISMVDTAIHYRYFSKTAPLTDYKQNILEHDLTPQNKQISQIFLHKNRNRLFTKELESTPLTYKPEITDFRKEWLKDYRKADSVERIPKKIIPIQEAIKILEPKIDSTKPQPVNEVDINNYIFEVEKLNMYNERLKNTNYRVVADTSQEKKQKPKILIYQTAFYTNYLVSQVDFTFLSASYQPFTGGGVYYNPGFNLQFKVGTNDLFENYKIVGGCRFSIDFQSNEYLLSFENLKKRIDKQFIFHRQAYKNSMHSNADDRDYYLKTTTTDCYYILKYPFSQVFAVKGTLSGRYDRIAPLSTDTAALAKPNYQNIWGGLKLELVFDNIRPLGINILSGSRFKVFGEAYKQINLGRSDLFVVGADFRHYQVIHRNLILASRFAGSSSFGGSRLIYYLGSVDGWINLSSKVPTFDNSVPIDDKGHYAYQTLATNMRGFVQNVRNGNNFAVINNEIRWPFIKYFANYPISSNFWSSLQVVGFFDVGSAWTGLSPFSGKNAYDNDVVPSQESTTSKNPVIVTLRSNRSPIVYGYGFGARAQLLGYFIRLDWAWGVDHKVILPHVFYLSLNLDF